MLKNKLLLLLLLPFALQAVITQEQFMQLSKDKTWEVYSTHIENYRRIFHAKDQAITQLESSNIFWHRLAYLSTWVAGMSALVASSLIYKEFKYPRLPRG